MGMMHEPGYIPRAGKPNALEIKLQIINAQRDAAKLYAEARGYLSMGRIAMAAVRQENAENASRWARQMLESHPTR